MSFFAKSKIVTVCTNKIAGNTLLLSLSRKTLVRITRYFGECLERKKKKIGRWGADSSIFIYTFSHTKTSDTHFFLRVPSLLLEYYASTQIFTCHTSKP